MENPVAGYILTSLFVLISQGSEPITCEPASMESQQHLKRVPATSYKSETTKKTKLIAVLHPPCLYSYFISHVQFYVLCNVHTEAFRAYRFRTNRSIQVVQPNGRAWGGASTSPLPIVTTSLQHHFPSSPPYLIASYSFVIYCYCIVM